MGKIYDAIREAEKEEEFEEISAYELNYDYVEIPRFIEVLQLYTDDSDSIIYHYLLNSDDFIELKFFEETYEDGIFQIIEFKPISDSEEVISSTLDIIENIAGGNKITDVNDYYWKKEDILNLDSMKKIGLNDNTFETFREATYYNPVIHLNLLNENKDLKQRLDFIQSQILDSEYQRLKEELSLANYKIQSQKEQISQLQDYRDNPSNIPPNDKKLTSRTANNASKIISALASELLGMDLTQPYSDETNGKIREAIEKQGNKLGKDKIADWLKLAHDQSK